MGGRFLPDHDAHSFLHIFIVVARDGREGEDMRVRTKKHTAKPTRKPRACPRLTGSFTRALIIFAVLLWEENALA